MAWGGDIAPDFNDEVIALGSALLSWDKQPDVSGSSSSSCSEVMLKVVVCCAIIELGLMRDDPCELVVVVEPKSHESTVR